MSWPDLPSTRWNPCVTLLVDNLLLPLPVSVDDELRQAAFCIPCKRTKYSVSIFCLQMFYTHRQKSDSSSRCSTHIDKKLILGASVLYTLTNWLWQQVFYTQWVNSKYWFRQQVFDKHWQKKKRLIGPVWIGPWKGSNPRRPFLVAWGWMVLPGHQPNRSPLGPWQNREYTNVPKVK